MVPAAAPSTDDLHDVPGVTRSWGSPPTAPNVVSTGMNTKLNHLHALDILSKTGDGMHENKWQSTCRVDLARRVGMAARTPGRQRPVSMRAVGNVQGWKVFPGSPGEGGRSFLGPPTVGPTTAMCGRRPRARRGLSHCAGVTTAI